MSRQIGISEFDSSELQSVVQLAEEIVSKNKLIDMDKLFRRAKRELNIHSEELFFMIKHLFNEGIFVEGSRLIKQELLKNHFREEIYKFIKKYPGINFSAIKKFVFSKKAKSSKILKELGSSGHFIWHLEILLKFQCLKKVDYKKYSLFIPDDMDPEVGIYYFLIRDKINRKIFNYLIENGSIKQSEIPELIGLSRQSVSYRLNALKEKDLIISEKAGKTLEIRINPDKKEQILEIYNDIEIGLLELKEKNKILPKEQEKKSIKIIAKEKEFEEKIDEIDKIGKIYKTKEKKIELEKTEKISEKNKNPLKEDKEKTKKKRIKIR